MTFAAQELIGGVMQTLSFIQQWESPGTEAWVGERGTPALMLEGGNLRQIIKIGVHPNCLLSAGEPGTRSGVVLGAVTGAGVTALLALCLFLIYLIVKTRRKKAAKTAMGVDDIHPPVGPPPMGALIEPQPGSLTDHPPPTLTVCSSGEKEEVHYAMLRFQKRQPGNPQKQQVPDNKYSEVNISN
ncbi:PREDICTED: myeloid cell surface antigen CD33-like [Hipposideros armiger]|uniref:Myeloid cell surface antigen CD33-like n=1 Tax=Hipposideros armiger TaxID=186990 RepID=A0A8B7QN87_HIPAR|nr:PREDICTED: myeloid cell surface antigen CD33-like [Hipposideros armiger]